MRYLKIAVFTFFSVAILSGKSVFAVSSTPFPTPNPTIVPEVFRPACGFADTPGANKCCPKVDMEKTVLTPARSILRGALFDWIADDIVDTIGLIYEIDPISAKLQIGCYTGIPEITQVKNPTTGEFEDGPCFCSSAAFQKPVVQASSDSAMVKICDKYVTNDKEHDACLACAKRDAFMTGLGCIPTDIEGFITGFLLTLGIGFSGLFSIGCIIYSAIMIQISQGNAEKIGQAQEQIKACVFGLLIIMFSILILRIIGIDILQIPGFS